MATLTAARVTNKESELGSITPGKFADLILVDGDPTKNISDIRNVVWVMKDGKIFDPDKLYAAVGVAPATAKSAKTAKK